MIHEGLPALMGKHLFTAIAIKRNIYKRMQQSAWAYSPIRILSIE